MKWTLKRFMLKVAITILALYIAINTVKLFYAVEQPIKIIKQNEQVADSKYIISEEAVMSKLRSKSQIVSMQQDINKKDVFVDSNFFGERHTQLKVHGTYKLGLETKDVEIQHIDNDNGIIFIHIGSPTLISLDIPYDQIHFEKTQGFFRLATNEEEQHKFYKSVVKNIEKELMSNKELLKQADIHNKDVIMSILKLIPEVKSIVFQ